jgi:hypothetical protein
MGRKKHFPGRVLESALSGVALKVFIPIQIVDVR